MPDTSFDATALDRGYAFIDACPPALFPMVATLALGSLRERITGILAWRESLLQGRLPSHPTWPHPPMGDRLARGIETLGIARFCKDQPDLVDAVLQDLLRGLHDADTDLLRRTLELLRELEAEERRRLLAVATRTRRAVGGDAGRGVRLPGDAAPEVAVLDAVTMERLRVEARRLALDAVGQDLAGRLVDRWSDRVRIWSSLAEVFDDLAAILGLGWDLSRGILAHRGWTEILRLQEILRHVPELQELVRILGRLQARDDAPPVLEEVILPMTRAEEELREIRTPLAPTETRGIERSGEISRMLPAEAALLGHPRLKYLWHARRAERALLSYRVEGILTERSLLEAERPTAQTREHPRPHRGPIVVCVDTSGSMGGLPSQVAKAVTLEAMRVAHAEKRRCYLYLFSGPNDVTEHDLDLGPQGIGALLQFLLLSFDGGTDVVAPLHRALERLEKDAWKRADVLLVSDGEFPVSAALVHRIRAARERGENRIHGLLVGSSSDEAMTKVCEPVHRFTSWGAFLEGNRRRPPKGS